MSTAVEIHAKDEYYERKWPPFLTTERMEDLFACQKVLAEIMLHEPRKRC